MFSKRLENTLDKKKLLVTINFSISHSVFKKPLLQTQKKHMFVLGKVNPFQTSNFRLFQTERVSRLHFEFDENDGKFSKRIENTVGKGEIAQFLLFP